MFNQKFQFVIQVWIVLFTLFVSVYGDVTHLYDAPRASEVNSIRHLSGVENGLPIHQPHAFQPTISVSLIENCFV